MNLCSLNFEWCRVESWVEGDETLAGIDEVRVTLCRNDEEPVGIITTESSHKRAGAECPFCAPMEDAKS